MLDIALELRIGNSCRRCGLEKVPQQELSESVTAGIVGWISGRERLECKYAAGELVA